MFGFKKNTNVDDTIKKVNKNLAQARKTNNEMMDLSMKFVVSTNQMLKKVKR